MNTPSVQFTTCRNDPEGNLRLTQAAAVEMWNKCDSEQRKLITLFYYPEVPPGAHNRKFAVSLSAPRGWYEVIDKLVAKTAI